MKCYAKRSFRIPHSAFCIVVAVVSATATADAVKVGLHETGNIHVDSGTVTQSDPVILGDKAKFYKTGAGELVLPLANVNRQRDYSLTVLDGKMTLSAGEDATVDAATPPAVLQRAAFWVNTDSVVTDANGLVTKWCDVRETSTASPTCWYAEPRWGTLATTYANVPPELGTIDNRPGVYFYGRASNVYMRFMTNSTEKSIGTVRHIFLVHGVASCWGAAVGYTTTREGGMVPDTDSFIRNLSDCRAYFVRRADLSSDFAAGRFYLNGQRFDPFTTVPKTGVSLLECDFLAKPSASDLFFRTNFETYRDRGNQGGDYLCEVIIFTGTLLSEKDRLDVERYLLKKWNLPYHANAELRLPMPLGAVGVASNATVEVSAANGEQTTPMTFEGEGAVRKTGAGALMVGPSTDTPFNGSFTLEEGSVISAGGRPPSVKAMSGDIYDSSRYLHNNSSTPDNIAKSGMRLTRATNGAAGVFRKTGVGEVRLSGVDESVERLNVEGGVVSLETKTKVAAFVPCGTVITAAVPNASFEMPLASINSSGRYSYHDATVNGWQATSYWCDYATADHSGWSNWADEAPPDGRNVFILRGNSGAQTTVTFPKAGRYELTLWACDRYGQQYVSNPDKFGVNQVNLLLGKASGTMKQFGTVLAYGRKFTKFRFMLPETEVGDYILRLRSPNSSYDESTCIDDIRITYVGESEETVAFKVPNGDFEALSPRSKHPTRYGFFTPLDEATGWTFEITDSRFENCLTNFAVGVAAPSKHIYSNRYAPLYSYGIGKTGSACLAFVYGYGRASTTFTVPAGTYRLRCNAAWTPTNHKYQNSSGSWVEVDANNVPRIAARLVMGGVTSVSLGEITPNSTLPNAKDWPTAFSFAEPTQVTLVLEQSNTAASGTIDDLVLVAEEKYDAGELLKDGGFESLSSWTRTTDNSYYRYSQIGQRAYMSNPASAYGYNVFEGDQRGGFKDECLAVQTVTFPTAGLHRFRLHANTRIDSDGESQNPLRFWYHAVGSTETNVIDVMLVPRCFNWFEREYLFDIPVAGDYKFGIEGGYSLREGGYGIKDTSKGADRYSFLDGCSIRRVVDEMEDAPVLPRNLRIAVSSGSRLVLNFPGTVQVHRVTLGDTVIREGVVSEKTHPQYIGGMGSLTVVPVVSGLRMIVR